MPRDGMHSGETGNRRGKTSALRFSNRSRCGCFAMVLMGAAWLNPTNAAWAQSLPTAQPAEALSADSLVSVPSVLRLPPLSGQSESPVITALAISRDGGRIAAAGDDHAIRIVSCRDGKILATLTGHLDWVQAVDFDPSGSALASCAKDGSVMVWRLDASPRSTANGESARGESEPMVAPKLLAHRSTSHALLALVFASETTLYTAGFSDALYRMDLTNLDLVVAHRSDCHDIRTIACAHQHDWIAYGGRDGIVRVLDRNESQSAADATAVCKLRWSQAAHFDRIRGIAFTSGDDRVISVGEDRRMVSIDAERGTMVSQWDIAAGKLMALQLLDDSKAAVSGSDNCIRIVDLQRGNVVSKLIGHDGSIAVLRRTPSHLVSGGFDTTIRTWNIQQSLHDLDASGRFLHPIAAQFEDSSSQESIR